jgi:hypothetical protein
VRWIWLKVGSSLRVGLQDAWETTGKRMTLGLGLLGVTVILAIVLATRQPVALLSFLAYPVVFAGACIFFVSRRLTGWSRLWREEVHVPLDGTQFSAVLRNRRFPLPLPLPFPCEVTCVIRDPAGARNPDRARQCTQRARLCQLLVSGVRSWPGSAAAREVLDCIAMAETGRVPPVAHLPRPAPYRAGP